MICPLRCFTGRVGYSFAAFIAASETSTAPNETALHAKHIASPSVATRIPPRAAPNTRARFIATELSVTAFARSSSGTISVMKLCLAGLSKTLTNPSASASTTTDQTWMTCVPVRTAKSAASRPDRVWVT